MRNLAGKNSTPSPILLLLSIFNNIVESLKGRRYEGLRVPLFDFVDHGQCFRRERIKMWQREDLTFGEEAALILKAMPMLQYRFSFQHST